ncbi:MAG: hypothetical protein KDD38_09660 [Bdellovibrionales bacterium]|nr:hypothetical protein [Bdellovibrionales bacterium]
MKLYMRLILITGISILTISFQNCSEVDFSPVHQDSSQKAHDESTSDLDNTLEVGEVEEPIVDIEAPTVPPKNNNINFNCNIDNISDIRVNVAKAYIGQTEVTVATGDRSLVSMAEGFNILITNPAKSNQLRLVLNPDNNQIVDSTGQTYALKTPSAQQSGFKILLNRTQKQFEGNTAYTVKFTLDPNSQIVRAGKKCILKPVVHSNSVVKFEF